jgi:hypothetical protein
MVPLRQVEQAPVVREQYWPVEHPQVAQDEDPAGANEPERHAVKVLLKHLDPAGQVEQDEEEEEEQYCPGLHKQEAQELDPDKE